LLYLTFHSLNRLSSLFVGIVAETTARRRATITNFKKSIERINQLSNEAGNHTVFGLTKFSDMTPEEFKQLLGYIPSDSPVEDVFPRQNIVAPEKFDWRSQNRVTPVKDQKSCGSCWAFATTENIESVYMIANNIDSTSMSPLSVQEIVDCDTGDSGCNGGAPQTAYKYVISAGGLETNADYPYTAKNGRCAFDKTKVYTSILNWKYATQSANESEMQSNAITYGPLAICVDASKGWQDYTGGILMASSCGTSHDHCVQAVGWDTTGSVPYWIVRNSWGNNWGESGYIRLQFGKNTCALAIRPTSSCIKC